MCYPKMSQVLDGSRRYYKKDRPQKRKRIDRHETYYRDNLRGRRTHQLKRESSRHRYTMMYPSLDCHYCLKMSHITHLHIYLHSHYNFPAPYLHRYYTHLLYRLLHLLNLLHYLLNFHFRYLHMLLYINMHLHSYHILHIHFLLYLLVVHFHYYMLMYLLYHSHLVHFLHVLLNSFGLG